MNLKKQFALAGTAAVLGLLVALSSPAFAQNAAADGQVPGPAPSSAYVWMAGQWSMEAGQWKWIAAHWELPPTRSAVWIAGHWASVSGKWVWINGAWNASAPEQAQATPPQAPSGAMPMPSSPPPLINNAYSDEAIPGSVPQTTDYGPINYAVSDPGYYWPVDPYLDCYPWGWSYPGAYIGLGWGPAYFGYHGGGRGYWGHGYGGGYARAGRGGAAPVRGGFSGHAVSGRSGGFSGGSRR